MSKIMTASPVPSTSADKSPQTDDAYARYWLYESDASSDGAGSEPRTAKPAAQPAPSDDAYAEYWLDTAS